MSDLPRLVESWQRYRAMLAMIALPVDDERHIDLPESVYLRLVNDLAMVIRRRMGL